MNGSDTKSFKINWKAFMANACPTSQVGSARSPLECTFTKWWTRICYWGKCHIRSPLTTPIAAPISIGSPKDVPVPCISSPVISFGLKFASFRAPIITSCCDGPFGAVKLLDFPSYRQNRRHTTLKEKVGLLWYIMAMTSIGKNAGCDHYATMTHCLGCITICVCNVDNYLVHKDSLEHWCAK